LLSNPDLLKAKEDLSLLVSAAPCWNEAAALKVLLDMGSSPEDQVTIGFPDGNTSATIWLRVCVFFAAQMVYDVSDDIIKHTLWECEALEHFLAVGVDVNCSILLVRGKNKLGIGSDPTHIISLRQLVQQHKPPNLESLSRLMDRQSRGTWPTLRAT